MTTCNGAYGVVPDKSDGKPPHSPHTSNTDHNKAQCATTSVPTNVVFNNVSDLLERNDAYNNPIGGWLERGNGTNVKSIQDLEDDGPDYENLVSLDHLFGEHVQPEFVMALN